MVILVLLFLLLSVFNAAESQQNITLGSSLTPSTSSSWLSCSGLYAFGFRQQPNGYAVGVFIAEISDMTILWTANRDNPIVPDNVTLLLSNDGRLILQQPGAQDIDVVDQLSQYIASASMLDNGNFVLYDSRNRLVWQSFDHPTDTLLPGQRLSAGNQLVSRASPDQLVAGNFRLKMQTDGNLVQYPANTPDAAPYAYYSSSTAETGNNVSLNLDNDGYLYLLNGSSPLRNITSGGFPTIRTIHLMRIDIDGIFRVYSPSLDRGGNWTIRWSSTNDACQPMGLCGLNSFCTQLDEQVDCRCLTGFVFIQTGNWSAGCSRNFIGQGCNNRDTSLNYVIRTEENTAWEDNSYAVLNTITQESCEQACLNDCNCEATFFRDRQCQMQRLPLRFGRRLLSDSNIALIKVVSPGITTGNWSNNLDTRSNNNRPSDILIVCITLVALAVLVLAISGIFVFHKKHVGAYKRISDHREVKLIEDVALLSFTYADLVQATNEFNKELGKGASGTVFKGILPYNQKTVAVKRLEKETAEGEREFQTEMKVIGKTYDRNLVWLIGYCLDGLHKLLVFEYMSNGSLANILFEPEKSDQLGRKELKSHGT